MLPMRAQNNTKADFTTAAAGMRGSNLRSETCVRISAERAKIFRSRQSGGGERLSLPFPKTFPFQLGNFFDELLHVLVTAYGLANPLFPYLGNTDLAWFPRVTLN